MTSTASLGSVIAIAAASSVARASLITAVGYVSVKYRPRNGADDPIIPVRFVGSFARTNYLLLLCPLFYSGIGKTVTPSVLAKLWPVIVGFFFIVFAGVVSATALSFLPGFRFLRRERNRRLFESIRVAAALPNTVALPLLVFPSLCEYEVVHESFSSGPDSPPDVMIQECTESANVIIFVCQFAFCFYFFCMGEKTLLRSSPSSQTFQETQGSSPIVKGNTANNNEDQLKPASIDEDGDVECLESTMKSNDESSSKLSSKLSSSLSSSLNRESFCTLLKSIWEWLNEVFGSAGSIAMILGLITGCIPWLPSALFVPGGSLRFIGGALESLGQAATPVSLIVVGASLFDPEETQTVENEFIIESNNQIEVEEVEELEMGSDQQLPRNEANTIASLPQQCHCLSEETMTHIWFILSRLVLAPTLVCATLIGLDCGVPGLFAEDAYASGSFQLPHLFKLVMMVVSSAPSAMTIIVVLKAVAGKSIIINDPSGNHASCLARRIGKLYLPLYALSTVTVAAWSLIGLFISLPDEDGRYFCEARNN
mmetsp:Transcript_22803/g.25401  ORF Transcript_22803/g.25401 Transcript_22803/m.25401 type:complete len:541 (-) Transcript_22803:259-1881(-)